MLSRPIVQELYAYLQDRDFPVDSGLHFFMREVIKFLK